MTATLASASTRAVNRAAANVRVGDIMETPVRTIDADETLWEAAARLTEQDTAPLIVIEAGLPIGVIDERVMARSWPSGPYAARRQALREIVSMPVHVVRPHVSVIRAAAIMLENHVEAVPVLDRSALVGVVTVRNLLELLAFRDPRVVHVRGHITRHAGSSSDEFRGSRNRTAGARLRARERVLLGGQVTSRPFENTADGAQPDETGGTDVVGWPIRSAAGLWDLVDEWGRQSFPASDPPANW